MMMEEVVLRNTNLKSDAEDLHFYGNGKLMLSGEYFVMDGAQSLAVPTRVGQSLTVRYGHSFDPKLTWKSFDVNGNVWFEGRFEFWHFNSLGTNNEHVSQGLQKILNAVRKQAPHFLRDDMDVVVETHLGFPNNWGLGSSSTLIYNIAQWAYISPFELFFDCHGGSGYDLACAQSEMPIVYEKTEHGPNWSLTKFSPSFKDQLYLVHLGKKQDSSIAVAEYKKQKIEKQEIIANITTITQEMIKAKTLTEFEFLMKSHEKLVNKTLGLKKAKDEYFSDYWGEVKSLGAWGGDFILASSRHPAYDTFEYFKGKGFPVVLLYEDLVLDENSLLGDTGKKYERVLH